MTKIVLTNKSCQILDEYDLDFLNKLDQELSFFVPGANYSKAFKGYYDTDKQKYISWDGRKRLLTNDLKFSPGLLDRVKSHFISNNKQFTIIDNRRITRASKIDILGNLKEINKIPYYYQVDSANLVHQFERGIFRMATGSGKSITMALIVAELGKPTIVYVIGTDLLYQLHSLFELVFKQKIGIIGDGKCDIHDLNVASVWTVAQALGLKKTKADEEGEEKAPDPAKYKYIRDALGRAKVHILDECHLSAAPTIQGIFKTINPEHLYGMSASPWRDDGADLLIENYLGHKIIDISARRLITEKFLVPPTIRFLSVAPYEYKSSKNYKTLYNKYIVQNASRNNMIVKGATKLVEQGFSTLVLFHSINHGKILYDQLKQLIPCEMLSGKDSSIQRQKTRDNLESGKIKCILASKIFDIGVDLPSLSGLIAAGAGKSSVRALQRIGRVIRSYPNKERAAVIEFADQAPWLLDHALARKKIYEEEFEVVQWPEEKIKD